MFPGTPPHRTYGARFQFGLPILLDDGDATSSADAPTNRRSASAGHGRAIYTYDFFFFALDLRFRLDFGGSSPLGWRVLLGLR